MEKRGLGGDKNRLVSLTSAPAKNINCSLSFFHSWPCFFLDTSPVPLKQPSVFLYTRDGAQFPLRSLWAQMAFQQPCPSKYVPLQWSIWSLKRPRKAAGLVCNSITQIWESSKGQECQLIDLNRVPATRNQKVIGMIWRAVMSDPGKGSHVGQKSGTGFFHINSVQTAARTANIPYMLCCLLLFHSWVICLFYFILVCFKYS